MKKAILILAACSLLFSALPAHMEGVFVQNAVFGTEPSVSIGSRVQFEGQTLSGEVLTSDEVFSRSGITLLCALRDDPETAISILKELSSLMSDRPDLDFRVIACCQEEDGLLSSPEFLADSSLKEMLCLISSESLSSLLPPERAFIGYYIDRDGLILDIAAPAASASDISAGLEDNLNQLKAVQTPENVSYVVWVRDQFGDPVPGVYVNFCTDSLCQLAQSDEEGMIHFEGVPYAYHVQIIKVPADYSFSSENDIYTDSVSSEFTVVVNKNT